MNTFDSMSSRCVPCGRSFGSNESLQQHKRESPRHTFDCVACDRHYGSKRALEQHVRDSRVHNSTTSFCETCNRSFSDEQALQQHVRDSPVHAPSFHCDDCDLSFDSEETLQQHLRESTAHALSFDCETCNRSFGNEDALAQHLRYSRIHQQDTETPLDIFFRSFPTFDYDPSLPPATSYGNLQREQGWARGSAASGDAWNRYQDALQSELQLWYGAENDLTAWHALCRAIGIDPLPNTCEQCEEAARRTHVNIIDLIEWGRSRSEEKVHTFHNVEELREYTKETHKIFRNTLSQEDGNVVLRHLLRKIFRVNL